jgi:hypothetical protein
VDSSPVIVNRRKLISWISLRVLRWNLGSQCCHNKLLLEKSGRTWDSATECVNPVSPLSRDDAEKSCRIRERTPVLITAFRLHLKGGMGTQHHLSRPIVETAIPRLCRSDSMRSSHTRCAVCWYVCSCFRPARRSARNPQTHFKPDQENDLP